MNVADPLTGEIKTRRVPLLDKEGKQVQSVAQAVIELKRLQTQRLDDALPILERTPKFRDYADKYLAVISSGQGPKSRAPLKWISRRDNYGFGDRLRSAESKR